MNVFTQISGDFYPHNIPLLTFKNMLAQLGVSVTHPTQDESFSYTHKVNAAWQKYNNELFFYESIAASTFHILYNDGAVDKDIARQIIYAILKNRPIVMIGELAFAKEVSSFTRELITSHMDQFHIVDLVELDLTELSRLFTKIKPIDYQLLSIEKILINAQVKAHFRALLDQAKK